MCETHAGALATKTRVGETSGSAIEASGAEGVVVCSREGTDLSVRIEILVGAKVTSLGLSMRREASSLMVWRAAGRASRKPAREAAKRWHSSSGVIVECDRPGRRELLPGGLLTRGRYW